MHAPPVFHLFGPAHLVVILLTLAVPIGLGVGVRMTHSRRADRAVAVCLSVILVVNYLGYAVFVARHDHTPWQRMLPLQLCDWAMVTVIVALLTHRKGWSEVSYFWGIGGTLQAVLTPNLQAAFPDLRFLSFFVAHCGIVAAVIYLLIARRFRPTFGSVWRTLAWSEFYLVVALLVDWGTGINYGFLLHKPMGRSILDYLSDERWLYILQLNMLALLFFAGLYLPFAFRSPSQSNRTPLRSG